MSCVVPTGLLNLYGRHAQKENMRYWTGIDYVSLSPLGAGPFLCLPLFGFSVFFFCGMLLECHEGLGRSPFSHQKILKSRTCHTTCKITKTNEAKQTSDVSESEWVKDREAVPESVSMKCAVPKRVFDFSDLTRPVWLLGLPMVPGHMRQSTASIVMVRAAWVKEKGRGLGSGSVGVKLLGRTCLWRTVSDSISGAENCTVTRRSLAHWLVMSEGNRHVFNHLLYQILAWNFSSNVIRWHGFIFGLVCQGFEVLGRLDAAIFRLCREFLICSWRQNNPAISELLFLICS